jgi:hypothetical protein
MLISELLAALSSFADGVGIPRKPAAVPAGASAFIITQLNQPVGGNNRLQTPAPARHPVVPGPAVPRDDADDEGGGGGDDDACDAEDPQSWHPQTTTAQPRFR